EWSDCLRDAHAFPTRRSSDLEERLDRMKKDLELTEEQVTKIKPILAEAREKMDELRGKLDNDRDALREKGKAIWDETRAKIDERSEEHTSNSSHVKISYAVFC